MSSDNTIVIFDAPKSSVGADGRPIQARGFADKFQEAASVSAAQLEENFSSFIANMGAILDKAGALAGGFQVDKLEIEAMVSADGKVGLAGSSVGLSGKSSLKIILTRRDKD